MCIAEAEALEVFDGFLEPVGCVGRAFDGKPLTSSLHSGDAGSDASFLLLVLTLGSTGGGFGSALPGQRRSIQFVIHLGGPLSLSFYGIVLEVFPRSSREPRVPPYRL